MLLSARYPYLILITALVGALILSAGCLSEQPSKTSTSVSPTEGLTFYTEQLPPFNYVENGTLKGISVDLLEAVTERMGSKVTREQVHLVPWTEGYQTALSRNNTVLFTTVRLPQREDSFKWAGPVYAYTNVLFARPDRGIVIEGSESLKGYRIGVITDDVAIQQLLDAGVNRSQLVEETNASVLVGKLRDGEIDLWAYPEASGRSFARQVTGNSYSFRVVSSLPAQEGWYAFNRNVSDSTVRSFQQALDALKTEKDIEGITTYERTLGHYIPSIGLARLDYLTEEWAPYNYQKEGVSAGIAVEILEAAFRTMGVNRTRADVRIIPLSEGLQKAQGTNTVLFSIVRTPEREPLYQWAGPFTKGSFVVFAPTNRNLTLSNAADLNQYRIGAVKGTVENTLLTDRGVNASHIANGLVPADLVSMLEKGEIDLWATGDATGRYEMQVAGVDPDTYGIVYTLSENDFYFIFSRDVPGELVSAFEEAIWSVRNQRDETGTSEYERIIYREIGAGCTRQPFSDTAVAELVNRTAEDIRADVTGTLRRINAGEAPYRGAANPELYVFVYDTNLTVVANAVNPLQIGANVRGKPDVSGKLYRDEILAGAQKNGSGTVEYVYSSPSQVNVYYKTTYYQMVKGSDGNSYIVCSGNYKPCGA